MSLYLGNLSPRVRREELERVFWKFGPSSVRLKDGYGFVVYEVPADAERALRALRGKIICGERISMTWSNKQPRVFHRIPRNDRIYDPPHTRNIRELDNNARIRDANDTRGSLKHQRHHPREPFIASADEINSQRVIEENDESGRAKGVNLDEVPLASGPPTELGADDTGRWGEPISDLPDGKEDENYAEFGRYDSDHGYDRENRIENHNTLNPRGSPMRRTSPGKWQRAQFADVRRQDLDYTRARTQPVCYGCGSLGHIIRKCPRGPAGSPDRNNRLNHKTNDGTIHRGDRELWRRGYSGHMGSSRLRHRDSSSKGSQPLDAKRLHREKESWTGSEEKYQSRSRKEYQAKRRRRKHEDESLKKRPKKRLKRSSSSSSQSDSGGTQSKSLSHSSKSAKRSASNTRSRSRTRPVSVESCSHSSRLRSASISSDRKSLNHKPRSQSRSKGSQRSVSVSSGSKPRSTNEMHTNDSLADGNSLYNKQDNNFNRYSSTDLNYPESRGVLTVETMDASFKTDNEFPKLHLMGAATSDCLGVEEGNSYLHTPNYSCYVGEKSHETASDRAHLEGPLSADVMHPVIGCEGHNSTSISPQEMFKALKHYGMEVSEQYEHGMTVETYFGSARMWPWDIIYYRRLKKGPISTENYARRVAQNQEFGIVDKYIRSSSGWGEREQNAM